MRRSRPAAAVLSALLLVGALSACGDDEARDVPITNNPGATPQDGDPVAPGADVSPSP